MQEHRKIAVAGATGPSPEQQAATEFFTTATRNLHQAGQQAGVQRMVVVSIIGCDQFTLGYNAAKVAHERAHAAGGIPVQILRAAQFHEFVPLLAEWGRQGDVCYIPRMRTQLIAARSVGEEALADLATGSAAPAAPGSSGAPTSEIAGPRAEDVIEMARLLLASRGDQVKIEGVSDPADPDGLYENGGLLPGPDAVLAGPTFEEWLSAGLG